MTTEEKISDYVDKIAALTESSRSEGIREARDGLAQRLQEMITTDRRNLGECLAGTEWAAQAVSPDFLEGIAFAALLIGSPDFEY
jgi:hypothetical protein